MNYVLIILFMTTGEPLGGKPPVAVSSSTLEFATMEQCQIARVWLIDKAGWSLQVECFARGERE